MTVYVPFGSLHQRRVGQRKNNCFLWFRFGNIGIGNAVSSCDGNDNDDINNNSLTAVQNPYTAFSRAFSIADIKPYDRVRHRVANIHQSFFADDDQLLVVQLVCMEIAFGIHRSNHTESCNTSKFVMFFHKLHHMTFDPVVTVGP
jgi:hypothetical protein